MQRNGVEGQAWSKATDGPGRLGPLAMILSETRAGKAR